MTRRLALAWCWGSVCGLVVGWVYGSAVRDLAAFRALKASARRSDGLPAALRPDARPAGNGAQEGAQGFTANRVAFWDDEEPALSDALRLPAQRDDEPCTHTLGSLTCPFRGPHDNHTYQGIYAPDAKSDADEEVE